MDSLTPWTNPAVNKSRECLEDGLFFPIFCYFILAYFATAIWSIWVPTTKTHTNSP